LLDDDLSTPNYEFRRNAPSYPDLKKSLKKGKHADDNKKYFASPDSEWFEINEPAIVNLILETYGDEIRRKILQHVIDVPRIVTDLIPLCGIPQTSAYRKIMSMVDNHLLTPCDSYVGKRNGRIITRYISTFKNIKIEIKEKTVTVWAQLNPVPTSR